MQSGQDHFTLTPDGSRIKTPNDPPGGIRLSREPSAAAQTYDLIVGTEENTPVAIDGRDLGVKSLQFGKNDLFRLFYSNLVSCYPQAPPNDKSTASFKY